MDTTLIEKSDTKYREVLHAVFNNNINKSFEVIC